MEHLSFDFQKAKTIIESGRVHIVPQFISHSMVQELRQNVEGYFENGKFKPSGISNRQDVYDVLSSYTVTLVLIVLLGLPPNSPLEPLIDCSAPCRFKILPIPQR